MRYSVSPELTTASVVRGLCSDHDRRCWTTLHRYQPAPIALIYRGLSVQSNRATSDGTTNLLKSRSIVFLVVSGIRTAFPPIGRISTQRGHSAELGLNSCKENCFPDSRLISLSEMSSKPYPSATSLRSSGGTSRRIEPSYFKFTKREGESLSAPSSGNWRTAARSPHPGSPTRKPADVQQYFTSMPASS